MASHRVIIVGAGAAGLAAGDHLIAAGPEVTLLEASERAGGRIRHLDGFADFPIELGAEEVHGLENCLVPLVRQAGAELLHHQTRNDYIRFDARLISLEAARVGGHLPEEVDFVDEVSRFDGPGLDGRTVPGGSPCPGPGVALSRPAARR